MTPNSKPSLVYKDRMSRHNDETWLTWSNKWGCWYRAGSSGYTSDIAQAGLYYRADAMLHFDGSQIPRKHRDTEPFPISAVRKHVEICRRQTILDFEKRMNLIDGKLTALATASHKPNPADPDLTE